ncbi:MAG: hypothetical protein JWO78_1408 [Micavibrio sp.]|nr:hypothetical protein [Micavibrio sp.]
MDEAFHAKSLMDYLVIFDPQQRIHVLYLASALFLALISFWTFRKDPDGPDTSKGFRGFVFGQGAYTHRSALQDYAFALVNVFVYYVVIAQLLISANACAMVMHEFFGQLFGPLSKPVLIAPWSKIVFTICSILAFDFALFWQHYLMHKIPILWHFHKVHHSAEVLNPITLYRMHPVDLVLSAFLAAIFGGTFYGLFWYLTGSTPQEYLVLGLNVVIFLFYIFGYNLRHSQVWFNYPAWLSHIIVSPAQHQVHHSIAPKHWDKNMGLIFSVWDKLFGTLYVPKTYEKLSYGISQKQPNPFNSVWDLYVAPFKWTLDSLKNPKERRTIMPFAVFIILAAMFFGLMNNALQDRILRSVHIEDLTWVEIERAQKEGFDSIIIPTGGTEQGGAHLAEGKHSFIVRYTAEKIAQQAGHMLVAPILSYVPEGGINPPEDNMRVTGTLSLSDKDYEAVLRDAAESYLQHGFRHIFFIGDSGPNQAAQDRVAKSLSSKGVVQISDYYGANGQVEWLLTQGFTKEQIGHHAGMRDTSELMVVRPDAVRKNPPGTLGQMGENGDYRLASKRIGKKMLELKVGAALRQMRPYLQPAADTPAGIVPKPDLNQKKTKPSTSDG